MANTILETTCAPIASLIALFVLYSLVPALSAKILLSRVHRRIPVFVQQLNSKTRPIGASNAQIIAPTVRV